MLRILGGLKKLVILFSESAWIMICNDICNIGILGPTSNGMHAVVQQLRNNVFVKIKSRMKIYC